jgi:ABC transport system ATP-binding/permease protein
LRDFPYFILAIVSLWLGVSVSAREIVRERPVFKRERMVNLGLIPYIGSKLAVLSLVLFVQCLLLLGVLKIFHVTGQMYLPGYYGGLAHLLTMVGIAMGLLVSCSVRSSETASSVVPLIMIPQIIFCGLVGEPKGVARAVGAIMPATWSFDLIKRQSTLETLTIGGGPVVELNKFITFLHPWGSLKRDPLILLMLFLTLITSALLLLRKQDRSGN